MPIVYYSFVGLPEKSPNCELCGAPSPGDKFCTDCVINLYAEGVSEIWIIEQKLEIPS